MSDPATNEQVRALISPRKLALQLAGFVVGTALLVYIITSAVREGNWARIAHAPPQLIAALLGCTLTSVVINAVAFWTTIRPVKPIAFWDLQRLNVFANMLNYAPVRLGAIFRVLYHVRVDGLSVLQVGAWFSLIAYTLVLGVAACVVATIVRFQVDLWWFAIVAVQVVAGGLVLRFGAGLPIVARYARGLDRMVTDQRSLWGAIALRMADLSMYTSRMAVAAAILGIGLDLAQIAMLAMVALLASLIPFGRVGFREYCVAAAGQQALLMGDLHANMNQLALMESAGEALVIVPLGIMFAGWFRRRWRGGSWPSARAALVGGDE